MLFHPTLPTGVLLRRYKRFLADIRLADGSTLTIHCPNTGSMRSCSSPGSMAAYSHSSNPNRKYPHTLEMVHTGTTWVGVNTARTNSLVAEAIEEKRIAEFAGAGNVRREVAVSKGTRLDLALEQSGRTTYVEVKNCSLVENGVAMFPDAVTERGTKHLRELLALAENGHGACIFFLIQRADCDSFRPASHIDPLYSKTLQEVAARGVMVLAYQARVSPASIEIVRRLPCHLAI